MFFQRRRRYTNNPNPKQLRQKHDILRTIFVPHATSGYAQLVIDAKHTGPSLSFVGSTKSLREARQLAKSLTKQRDDITHASPLRFQMIRVIGHPNLLLWTWHHALFDAWTDRILMKDLNSLLRSPPRHASMHDPRRGATFAELSRYLDQLDCTAECRFWKQYLQSARPVDLRLNRNTTELTARVMITVEVNLANVSATFGVTPSAVFLFAVACALGQFSGESEVAFGLILAGRTEPLEALDTLAGPCISTTVIRQELRLDSSLAEALTDFQRNLELVTTKISVTHPKIRRALSTRIDPLLHILAQYTGLGVSAGSKDLTESIAGSGLIVPSDLFIEGQLADADHLQISVETGTGRMSRIDLQMIGDCISRIICTIGCSDLAAKKPLVTGGSSLSRP